MIRVGVDVSPLRQTRAGTARRDRAACSPSRCGQIERVELGFGARRAGSARSSSTSPGTRSCCRGGARGLDVLHCPTYRAPARASGAGRDHDPRPRRVPRSRRRSAAGRRAYSRRAGAARRPRGAARARGLGVHEARGASSCSACPRRGSASSRTASSRCSRPDGRGGARRLRARRRHARAAQEPAAPRRGGPAPRGRAARRGRPRLGRRPARGRHAARRGLATTSSPASTAAPAASPTRRSTRASGSRCSRRWPAAPPS